MIELTHPETCSCWICEYHAQASKAGDWYWETEIAAFYRNKNYTDGTSGLLLNPLDLPHSEIITIHDLEEIPF